MTFTWDEIKDLLGVLNLIVTALVAVFVWLKGQDNATQDRISDFEEDVDQRFDDHSLRLQALEQRVASAPTHDDLKQLREVISRQSEKLDQLLGESRARNITLDRIHQWLLDQGK